MKDDVLAARFAERAGSDPHDLRATVLALSRVPYGRPSVSTAQAVVDEWRGTCSTKHLLLATIVLERPVALVHRVYTVTRELAAELFGVAVPECGLVDVHTYARLGSTVVDATFPVDEWDGSADMQLWCGPGVDFDAASVSKADLVARYCDPAVRERFIAALGS